MMLSVENLKDFCLYTGAISTFLFIAKTFLPIDFGTEVQGDFTSIADTDSSFNIFSIEGVLAFFMCSGWMGWVSLYFGHYSTKISLIISIISGICGMFFFAWLISQFKKLEQVQTYDLNQLVGKSGKAYMDFKGNSTSKIQIEFNSKLEIIDAKNISDDEIKAFEDIKVVKVENNIVYISKL